MEDFLVPALDGLIHLAAYIALTVLLILSIKIPTRGHALTGFFNALIVVAGAGLVRGTFSIKMGGWLPEQSSNIQFAAVIGSTFLIVLALISWRFALPFLLTLFSTITTTAALMALSIYVPRISETYLPAGKTFAQFVSTASQTIQQSQAHAKDMAAKLGTGKELEQNRPGALATALDAIATLTSEDEMDSLQKDFNAGVAFWKERKALMDAMTPEEKEAYRREMAAFLQENGLSENRYSLAAIKDVKKEDLVNAANFMKDLDSEFGGTGHPMNEKQVADASESLAKIARNIKGGNLSRFEKDNIGKLIDVLSSDGVDAAIAQTKQDVDELVGGNQVSSALLATLMELKSGISASTIIAEAQVLQAEKQQAGGPDADIKIARLPTAADAEANAEALAVIRRSMENTHADINAAPDLSKIEIPDWVIPEGMVSVKTSRGLGMVLIPQSIPMKQDWIEAAGRISLKGFVVSGTNGENVRAIIGKSTVGLSDKLAIRSKANDYIFKVTGISYGRIYITAINLKQS